MRLSFRRLKLVVASGIILSVLLGWVAIQPKRYHDVTAEEWALRMQAPQQIIRENAAAGFASVGPEIVPEMASLLQRRDSAVKTYVWSVFPKLPWLVRKALVYTFPKRDAAELRRGAASALAVLGPAAKDAIPQLIGCLADTESDAGFRSGQALASIGPLSVEPLCEALDSPNAVVRDRAVYSLSLLDSQQAQPALPKLVTRLADESEDVRIRTSAVLIRMAPSLTLNTLLDAVSKADPPLQAAALKTTLQVYNTLARESPENALLQQPTQAAKRAGAIGEIRTSNLPEGEQIKLLVASLRDPAGGVRKTAAKALGTFAGTNRLIVVALASRLKDPDAGTRIAAIHSLGSLGEQAGPALNLLRDLAADPDAAVAAAAAQAMPAIQADKTQQSGIVPER